MSSALDDLNALARRDPDRAEMLAEAALAMLSCETLPGLTPAQSRMIRAMRAIPGRVVSMRALLDAAQAGRAEFYSADLLRVHLSKLRGRLLDMAPLPGWPITIWGDGVRWAEGAEAEEARDAYAARRETAA